jgi:phage-related protein
MPRGLAASIIEDKNKQFGNPYIVLLEVTTPDNNKIRIAQFNESIYFPSTDKGKTPSIASDVIYEAMPVKIGDIRKSADGSIQTFSVTVANLQNVNIPNLQQRIGYYLDSNDGLINCKVTQRIISYDNMSSSANCMTDIYYIKGAKVKSNIATWILGEHKPDLMNELFPRGIYKRDGCQWLYKGADGRCGFTPSTGTARAATSTTITLSSAAPRENDYFNYWTIYIDNGTGAGQSRTVSDYQGGTTRKITVSSAWSVNPNTTSGYRIDLSSCNYMLGTGSETDYGGCRHHRNTTRFGAEPSIPDVDYIFI